MSEPRTEAGRTMLDGFAPMPLPDAPELHRRSAMGRRVKVQAGIVAIEAEARTAVLADLRAKVRGSDLPLGIDLGYSRGYSAALDAVLALLDPEKP